MSESYETSGWGIDPRIQYPADTAKQSGPSFYRFTVAQRYGAPFERLTPPEGYEFTGEFRPAKTLELSLGEILGAEYVCHASSELPALILRPLKRKRIIFEEVAKVPAGSQIAGHEFYQFGDHEDVFKATNASRCCTFSALTTIYSRREEEF